MQIVSEKQNLASKAFKKARIAPDTEPSRYQWTVDVYYRLGDLGFFDDKHVELIKGEILEMAPMKTPHAAAIQLVSDVLAGVFVRGYRVRQQLPLAFSETSEPEPDIAVVDGSIKDYLETHPRSALLVVEVSYSTLKFDRSVKAALYAEFGIAEYWIVNLRNRQLEIYRKPAKDGADTFYYAEQTIYREDQLVSTLRKPKAKIKVADILP